MNILFLSMGSVQNIDERALYTDLLRCFRAEKHSIWIVYPCCEDIESYSIDNVHYIPIKIKDVYSENKIRKALSILVIQENFLKYVKRITSVTFELVLYSTPPVTFYKVVEYIKKRDNAKTYLLLKDIFPQNSVDLGILNKNGLKGIIYRYFRKKEAKLYNVSDAIGCMSDANVQYILKHNNIDKNKIEVCPNCIEPLELSITSEKRLRIRKKYQLPLEKKIFIYGGSLGKPQGVQFIIECLQKQNFDDVFFLIVGKGTEYEKLREFVAESNKDNIKLMPYLPKEDYDTLLYSCDVGMIFLDYRFTIPNFPSRLLPYLQARLPVMCVTDPNTDIGDVVVENGFGFKCMSDDSDNVVFLINKIKNTKKLKTMGVAGFEYLKKEFAAEKAYKIIMNRVNQ